ncbi:hypothetical protein M422DRAFT_41878 [Sphaerobolus stellatus SS14]|nr:hypothetical protein M422DRAFT_41878 [Sphaerobolus stellatus SS14]
MAGDLPAFILTLENIRIGHGNISTKSKKTKYLPIFASIMKIASLEVYPLSFHPKHQVLKDFLLVRGKKWAGLANGIYHVYYQGTVASSADGTEYNGSTESRKNDERCLMIDYFILILETLRRGSAIDGTVANVATIQITRKGKQGPLTESTSDELLITSSILYGFSLSDKVWVSSGLSKRKEKMKFDVDKVSNIVRDDDAFTNLYFSRPENPSLVEAHNAGSGSGFDDFIKGKLTRPGSYKPIRSAWCRKNFYSRGN